MSDIATETGIEQWIYGAVSLPQLTTEDDEDEFDDEIERLVMWSGMIAIGTLETTTE